MSRRETLSLLIPAYNAAWCLPRLLRSAKAQTVPFDQIWVYDDCSTDDTAAVAAAHDAKVLQGEVNQGCSAGKNALARHVDTDWVHFHDADDELLPNFVARARRWIEQGDRDIVLFPYEWRDNETGELLAVNRFDHEALVADARSYSIRNQINPFCGLYRRQPMLKAGGYDTDPLVLYNEDVAFHIRMSFAGLSFGADCETCIVNYRVGQSMSAANQAKCAISQYHVMRRALALPEAGRYAADIGERLWDVSGRLAAHSQWDLAGQCAELARSILPPPPGTGGICFRFVAHAFPSVAVWARESAIRKLRPSLRPHLVGVLSG